MLSCQPASAPRSLSGADTALSNCAKSTDGKPFNSYLGATRLAHNWLGSEISEEKNMNSRRNFLKRLSSGALGLAGLGMAGCDETYTRTTVRPVHSSFDYYYYPDSNIYFHISTGTYYYYVDGVWSYSRSLPSYFLLDPYYRVRIVIRDRYPYLRNNEHRRMYRHVQRQTVQHRNEVRRLPPASQQPTPPRPRPEPQPRGVSPLTDRERKRLDAEERQHLEEELKRRKH